MATREKTRSPELVWGTPWAEFPWNHPLGRLLENAWRMHPEQLAPGSELAETDEAFVLDLDLPGVAKEDITIDVTGRRVSVRATRVEKERTGVLRHTTRTRSEFAYEVTLPTPVDDKAVTAELDSGVLMVRIPKAGGAKTSRIEIK